MDSYKEVYEKYQEAKTAQQNLQLYFRSDQKLLHILEAVKKKAEEHENKPAIKYRSFLVNLK
jgi:hypothetical protein